MEDEVTGNLVPVYVPEERVLDVYRYLGSTNGSEATAPRAATEPAVEDEQPVGGGPAGVAGTGWTEPEIVRDYEESPRNSMQPILKHMAASPDTELMTEDLAEAVGAHTGKPVRTSSVAGILGAYGNRTKSRYGKSKWYFGAKWDDERSGMIYKMPAEVAEIIKAL